MRRLAAREPVLQGMPLEVVGWTAPTGPPMIVSPPALEEAALAVAGLARNPRLGEHEGIVVAAFGDPGADELAACVAIPVIGIAQAAYLEAAAHGRFAVVTSTPLLDHALRARARFLGVGDALAGIEYTDTDLSDRTHDVEAVALALHDAVERATARWNLDALVIGGGPLAPATELIPSPVPLINPLAAAMRLLAVRIAGGR